VPKIAATAHGGGFGSSDGLPKDDRTRAPLVDASSVPVRPQRSEDGWNLPTCAQWKLGACEVAIDMIEPSR
jgi:hypothetical protein